MMFSLPLHSYQQPTQSRSKSSGPRKRKRKGSRTPEQMRSQNPQETDSYAGSTGSPSPSRQAALSAVLTPDEIYQYAVAGQPVEDELQGYPFPHADFGNRDTPSRFDYELRQQLKPALTSSTERDSPSISRSLHQQHLAVMTTILHRSLLEEDFVRASRALGMILRDEVGGKPVDVRAEGRWGIGAETLIRQAAQIQHGSREQSRPSSNEQNSASEESRAWFTRKGLQDAKKYYERLIVQYPFYKQNPGAVSALDFYPAMFGLWIYVVHQEAKLQYLESDFAGNGSDADSELMRGEVSLATVNPSRHQPTIEELSQASEIADRMDSVMSALPYREDINLVELRRMVRLWIRDLVEALESPPEEDSMINPREDTPVEFLTSGVTKVSLHGEM